MPAFRDSHTVAHSPRQMFDLVADVASYPEFLPWCRAARITDRAENTFLAELVIAFKGLTERYTSRVTLHPPGPDNPEARIDVVMVKGPFEHLENHWQFLPQPGAQATTLIDFAVDFQFRSRLLSSLMGALFGKASQKMASAFIARADALYGPGQNSIEARPNC